MKKYDYIPEELHTTEEPYAKVTYRDYTVATAEGSIREYSYKVIHVPGMFRPDFGIVNLVGHEGEYAVSPQDFLSYIQFNAPVEIPEEA